MKQQLSKYKIQLPDGWLYLQADQQEKILGSVHAVTR